MTYNFYWDQVVAIHNLKKMDIRLFIFDGRKIDKRILLIQTS